MAGSRPKTRLAMAATLLAAAVAVSGCTSSPTSAGGNLARSALVPALASQAAVPGPGPIPPMTPLQASEAGQATSPQTTDPQAMQQIVAEIQAMGALDPKARDELLENLGQTDPTLWPLVAQRVRADLAWRRQAEQREAGRAGPDASADGHSAWPAPAPGQTAPRAPGLQPGAGPSPTESPRVGGDVVAAEGRQSSADPPQPDPDRYAKNEGATPDGSAPAERVAGRPSLRTRSGSSPEGPVIAASYEAKADGDWQSHLDEAVERLESEVDGSPQSDRELAQQARLRMLYLLKGRRDEALRPIPSLAPAVQQFWSEQIYGLATLLDPELISESGRRHAEARQHLDTAVAKLGESCPLVVRNLAFVTEIQSYGSYKPFDRYEFAPGQRVLLYAEVENFKSIETAKGFHTATRSSYQIFDAGGKRVAEHEFSLCEEYCRRPRRDFFIVHDLHLPKRIYPGKHVLQLTVADLNSEKIGQTVIEFTVKSSGD